MQNKLIVLLVLCCTTLMTAQCCEQRSLINVNGVGEVKVVPDEVSLVISLQNFAADASSSAADNARQMAKIIEVIKGLGIDAKDYQTTLVDTNPRYKNDSDVKHLLGFFSSSSVAVKLRDLSKFSDLRTKSLTAGATSIGEIRFSSSKLIQHRAEARKMALQAAKEKAAFMAEQLGQKIGRAFTITEAASFDSAVQMYANAYQTSGSSEEGESMAAGVISVKEKVSVSFLLE